MFVHYVCAPATTSRARSRQSPGPKDFITCEYLNVRKGLNWPRLLVDCRSGQRPDPQSALKQVSHLRALTYGPFNALNEQKDKRN